MSNLAELNELLSGVFSESAWSDDAVLYARQMVEALTGEDWQTLQSTWLNHDDLWQERLAGILSRGEPERAVPVLTSMIEQGSDEVSLLAADSLRAFAACLPAPVLSSQAKARLDAISSKHRFSRRVISDLYRLLQESNLKSATEPSA